MPNVWRSSWKSDRVDPGVLERDSEALAELRGVEDVAGERVAEDEGVVGAEERALAVAPELAGQPVGHGN